MQGDKLTPLIKQGHRNGVRSFLTMYFFSFLSLFCVAPPPLPYNMMVSLLPGNLVCNVVHTFIEPKRKGKKFWQDTMTYPGGGFHWSLWSYGRGQPSKVCVCVLVCVRLQYMMVCLPQALCCGAVMLSVTPLRPEPCSQRNQLWSWQVCLLHSPTTLLFCSLSNTHTHTHKCNHIHTQKRSLFHGLRFWYTCTQLPPPLYIHTYPQTITQASGSLSHASYKHGAKGICSLSSEL